MSFFWWSRLEEKAVNHRGSRGQAGTHNILRPRSKQVTVKPKVKMGRVLAFVEVTARLYHKGWQPGPARRLGTEPRSITR